jgi:ribosomal-protein-alanine N-acetyltransferase
MQELAFEYNDETHHLNVSFETERLYLESVQPEYIQNYNNLYSDATNMEKFATGETWSQEKIKTRVNSWVERWNNNIPFSAFAVFLKEIENENFIGNVVFGYGEKPKTAEVAYVFNKKNWGKGYAKEAVVPIVVEYPAEIIERGYKIDGNDLETVVATSRIDNEASIKILKHANMKIANSENKYGHNRYNFFLDTSELMKNKHNEKSEEKANEKLTEDIKQLKLQ